MSDRLARLAGRVARRKSRGIKIEEWREVKGILPPRDPWAAIPEEARVKTVETLPDGTVLTSYDGTLEDHEGPARAPAPNPAEPEPEPKPAPWPRKATKPKGSRFADYPMPGHERP